MDLPVGRDGDAAGRASARRRGTHRALPGQGSPGPGERVGPGPHGPGGRPGAQAHTARSTGDRTGGPAPPLGGGGGCRGRGAGVGVCGREVPGRGPRGWAQEPYTLVLQPGHRGFRLPDAHGDAAGGGRPRKSDGRAADVPDRPRQRPAAGHRRPGRRAACARCDGDRAHGNIDRWQPVRPDVGASAGAGREHRLTQRVAGGRTTGSSTSRASARVATCCRS